MVHTSVKFLFNPLPNNKVLDVTKLKAFADDKFIVTKMIISLFHRVENPVEKGENADYSAFSPFPTVFSKKFVFKFIKSWDCVVKG